MKKLLSAAFKAAAAVVCCLAAVAAARAFLSFSSYYTADVEPRELAGVGSPYKIYYEKLDDVEKRAYNKILSEIYSMPPSIAIPALNAETLNETFLALLYDNPDLFFVGRKCSIKTKLFKNLCVIEYIMDKDEYAACKTELDKAAEKAVSSLTASGDEWLTELEIHDYIVDSCKYKLVESDPIYSSCYGALVKGEAACEGYAKAAKLLFDAAGIKSAVLSGISKNLNGESGPHMWNAVKIGGDYYHLDCTWDDPAGENDGTRPIIYSYFNLDDKTISRTHSNFSFDFHCDSTAENYYVKTGGYFETYDEACEKKLAELIADAAKNGKDSVQIRFGDEKVYNEATEALLNGDGNGGKAYEILRLAREKGAKNISVDSITYYRDPDGFALILVPKKK